MAIHRSRLGRHLLHNARRVLLAPDGALNLIPSGAVVDSRSEYRLGHYSFTYRSAARDATVRFAS